MTIAAGFVCREGLVLFADTEEQEGYIKTNVEKIRKLEKGGRCLVIANAGNGYLADSLTERLFETLATTKREKDVIPQFRTALIEFHRNEVSLYPSRVPQPRGFQGAAFDFLPAPHPVANK